MATALLSNSDFCTDVDDKYHEIFCLIWLDARADTTEIRDAEQNLRCIINYLKRFEDIKECQEYIEQKRSENNRFVLIVSGRLGREIVPYIHELQQVTSIYVYCMDKEVNKKWTSKFSKIKGVLVNFDELICQISVDHRIQEKIEEPLSITFTTSVDVGRSVETLNGEFVFSQVIIDCLLRLKSNQTDKNELINYCKNKYEGIPRELNNIRDFEENYKSTKALLWYTKESFFYKTLNTALRTQNFHLMFLFRSFIFDIYRQLEKNQSKDVLKVYRSQLISNDEFKTLQKSLHQFISTKSFFSTSINYSKALSFLKQSVSSNKLKQILFEIDVDPKITSKPFADISKYSQYTNELEVLFMIGSIFRIDNIYFNNDKIWIIQMSLYNDDQSNLQNVLQHMKQQFGDGETNLQTLAKILWEMGNLELAKKYIIRLLMQLSSNNPLLGTLYEDLGILESQTGNLDMSVHWREKSLAFKNQNQLIFNSDRKSTNSFFGQLFSLTYYTHIKLEWKQNGDTIVGNNGQGNQLNQLSCPNGIYIDNDDQCIYIADCLNNRILRWKFGETNGQIIAGGNGKGNRMNQLDGPIDVIVDKQNDSIIICDYGNKRIVRWPRQNGTNGQIIISNIHCRGLTMNKHGDLFVSDWEKDEVRRWKMGDENGILVAGGNGKGNHLNQLNGPNFIFVDKKHSVYVSDNNNHRIIKWRKNAKEGIIVAGGKGNGNSLTQLSHPHGIIVDQSRNLYVADFSNHRIMRWSKRAKEGCVIIGGNGKEDESNQFKGPTCIAFDQQGNLYVTDWGNHRIQKFDLN